MKVLDAEATRQIDRSATEDFGIPSLVLMENAAIGVADALVESFPEVAAVAIFCGPGNNGGDGLALARHLTIRGYQVQAYLLTTGRPLSPDAQTQLNICQSMGIAPREIAPDDDLHHAVDTARRVDLLVDALLGIGLTRPLTGQLAELVEALNDLPLPRLAIDLPSGLNASKSEIPGVHLEATLTVTFAAPKIAHVLSPAAEAVGELVVADLGVPGELIEHAAGDLHVLLGEELGARLMTRPLTSHKGDFGHVLIVAGSEGKAGAAILAARGAVRGGAGLVTVAAPQTIVQTVDLGSVESMTLPLPVTADGGLAPESVDRILEFAADKQAMALGPGLGLAPATVEVVQRVSLVARLPVVLDADALNGFGTAFERLRERQAATVLTPHPGELSRLLGVSTADIQADRVAAARSAAARSGALVVLKGHQSLVASPEGAVFINGTGNPGMATGGTGDVLTGLIVSLVGQGYEAATAAQLAVHLHGLAGDLAAESEGLYGLRAGDLLARLPEAFRRLEP